MVPKFAPVSGNSIIGFSTRGTSGGPLSPPIVSSACNRRIDGVGATWTEMLRCVHFQVRQRYRIAEREGDEWARDYKHYGTAPTPMGVMPKARDSLVPRRDRPYHDGMSSLVPNPFGLVS